MMIGVIGGGASGCLAAIRILEELNNEISALYLFDPNEIGAGVAYSDNDPNLILNVSTEKMGIDDFIRNYHPELLKDIHYPYVPRHYFKLYLQQRLNTAKTEKLHIVKDKVKKLSRVQGQWQIECEGKTHLVVDSVILATGYTQLGYQSIGLHAFDYENFKKIPKKSKVLIIGSGLSGIDAWRVLNRDQSIDFLSRRGSFPLCHENNPTRALKKNPDWVGQSPCQILRSLRAFNSCGVSWPQLADRVRVQATKIWGYWSHSERKQFIRHLKPYWNRIRHRVPGTVMAEVEMSIHRGMTRTLRGQLISIHQKGTKKLLTYRPYSVFRSDGSDPQPIEAEYDEVIDATGLKVEESLGSTDFNDFHVRPSQLGLGFENFGAPRFWSIGPASSAKYWEITAMPEICKQIEELIQDLKLNLEKGMKGSSLEVHPLAIGETYQQHLLRTFKMAGFFLNLSWISILHGVFPYLFTDRVSHDLRTFSLKIKRILMRH